MEKSTNKDVLKNLTKTQLLEMLWENPTPITGPVKFNEDILVKLWNSRSYVSKFYRERENTYEYRVVRYLRKNGQSCSKMTIAEADALSLISRLNLLKHDSVFCRYTCLYVSEGFSYFK